jgi:hypothetical protein
MSVLPLRVDAAETPVNPTWSRTLPAASTAQPVTILQPLPAGGVLVRSGSGAIALDAGGRTLWSMPNIDDATLSGSNVVFWRSTVVFAVRSSDAGVVWKRACANPPYVVAAADRLATFCGTLSTVLRAKDGSVLSTRKPSLGTGSPRLQGALDLNADYVLVSNFFEGAFMGNTYFVVDAHLGAFLWSQTDFEVVAVTPTTVSISQLPSMMPWSGSGVVQTLRLTDGGVVGSKTFAIPQKDDPQGKSTVSISTAAAYVSPMSGTSYRFAGSDPAKPEPIRAGWTFDVVTLGDAAFLIAEGPEGKPGTVYLDRPSAEGAFAPRSLGQYQGLLAQRGFANTSIQVVDGERIDNRVAIADGPVVRLYDESGTIELSASVGCDQPQLAGTHDMLFVLCTQPPQTPTLLAFRRRQ